MKGKKEKKKKKSGYIIAGIVIIAVISGTAYYFNQQKISEEGKYQWVTSGPFAIDKPQYRIGDEVFMVVSNLQPYEAGNMTIVDPKGDVYEFIPFNGTLKTSFHSYFKPNTQKGLKLCNPTDLVGNWTLAFRGVPYKPIKFQVINEWVQGSQAEIKPIPNC